MPFYVYMYMMVKIHRYTHCNMRFVTVLLDLSKPVRNPLHSFGQVLFHRNAIISFQCSVSYGFSHFYDWHYLATVAKFNQFVEFNNTFDNIAYLKIWAKVLYTVNHLSIAGTIR